MSNLYPPQLPDSSPHVPPHRTGGGSTCEFYLGQNAGAELLQDIQRARRSIVVVSPYVKPEFIQRLFERQDHGVHVTLLTMSGEAQKADIGRTLVRQHSTTDERALSRRTNGMGIASGVIALAVLAALWFAAQGDVVSAAGTVFAALLGFAGFQMARDITVYSYSYRFAFPTVRVFESPYGRGFPGNERHRLTVHSKVYIIDDQVAYLGSVNFTPSGLMHNFESSVRFTDPADVHRIRAMVESLCASDWWETRPAHALGSSLYAEPRH